MRYTEFEQLIAQMALEATGEGRRSFALDTIAFLRISAAPSIDSELTDAERTPLIHILDSLESEDLDTMRAVFNRLNESMSGDPVRAIEFDPHLTDLLCAVDAWLDYRKTGAPKCIEAIAVHRVNSLDYDISGQAEGYSIDNMLAAAEMRDEYERQRQMLIGGRQPHLPARKRSWWRFW